MSLHAMKEQSHCLRKAAQFDLQFIAMVISAEQKHD